MSALSVHFSGRLFGVVGRTGFLLVDPYSFLFYSCARMKRPPTLTESLIPISFLIVALSTNVLIFGSDGLSGSNQIILILSGALAAVVSLRTGLNWEELQEGIVHSIVSALPSILILLLIGSLSGTWLLSGIVPAMIYYGLQILDPTFFLFAACIICAIVSIATGSSWSTVATIGVALMGIGQALGIPEGWVAGAILSGSYFGDKISPLSDTTNLAPAVAGTDLFTHIRYMMFTTVPTFGLTLIIFLTYGLTSDQVSGQADIAGILKAIEGSFNITPWLFLVPTIVVALIVRRAPAVPAILAGALLGGLFALIFQPKALMIVSGESQDLAKACYIGIMKALYGTISIPTQDEMVSKLLSTRGMSGMLNTVWLILCSMVFGGIMEKSGMLQRITQSIIAFAHSTGSLIASTAATCLFFNLTASDQYLSIVVPGRMYAATFRKRGLAPENLSRTLEDSGTVTSVLIPWNTCGATQSTILQVPPQVFVPYVFFSIISPLMTILFGYLNLKIRRIPIEKTEES